MIFALKSIIWVCQHPNNMHKTFHKVFITGLKIRAIAKSAKIHPAAKKCCGWEEPAICKVTQNMLEKKGQSRQIWVFLRKGK